MTDYYVSLRTGALMSRTRGDDQIFRDGTWLPMNALRAYMVGRDDVIDAVTEDSARHTHPEAFASSTGGADGEPQVLSDGGLRMPHGWKDPETRTTFNGRVTVYRGDPLHRQWVRFLTGQEPSAL